VNILWCENRTGQDYWIGLRRVAATDWFDGNTSPYRPWAPGEPNSDDDQCIRYSRYGDDSDHGFRDGSCSNDRRYVCKKDAGIAHVCLILTA